MGLEIGFSLPQPAVPSKEKPRIEPGPSAANLKTIERPELPVLSPQEAFASGADLGPVHDTPLRSDNHPSKVHTEIKVNGKVIARVFNSGGIEIAGEYRFLSEELNFAADKMVGPDLAQDRAERIKAALARHGAFVDEDQDPVAKLNALNAQQPIVEVIQAATAQTQEEWLKLKQEEGPINIGAFLSRSA